VISVSQNNKNLRDLCVFVVKTVESLASWRLGVLALKKRGKLSADCKLAFSANQVWGATLFVTTFRNINPGLSRKGDTNRMEKSRKTIIATFVLGMVAMGGVLAAAAFGLVPGAANAAGPGSQGTPAGTQGGGTPRDYSPYLAMLEQSFAANLGVDQSKVDSSFTAAVNSTVDKAVQDGALTQDQATQVKGMASNGLQGLLISMTNVKPASPKSGNESGVGDLLDQAFTAGSALLKITPDDMGLAIKRDGKSLTDLAQAHGVDPQTLLNTMLQAGKSLADANVTSGKWTQVKADASYQDLTNSLNGLLNASPRNSASNTPNK
jgi:uncharacterized protein YidB (DUF937 family)